MSEYIVDFAAHNINAAMALCDGVHGEIVRCRDCEEFAIGDSEYATVDWCDYFGTYIESPDGFCAWGERRKDER